MNEFEEYLETLGPDHVTKHRKTLENKELVIQEIEKALGSFDINRFEMYITWAAVRKTSDESGRSANIDPKNPFMRPYPEVLEMSIDTIRKKMAEDQRPST